MYLFLEPVDVWLFRDGRPFDAASQHRAASVFPPSPSVVQGALRSHHLVVRHINLHDTHAIRSEVGTSNDYRNLRVRGPFLAREENGEIVRYFHQPADAITVDETKHTLRCLSPEEPDPEKVVTSAPTSKLLRLPENVEPQKGESELWLSEGALMAYLKGEVVIATPGDRLFQREDRLGIGMNNTQNTTEEGMLYEVEFIRPHEKVGLVLEVTGLNGLEQWPREGILRLGGEGRGARYRVIETTQENRERVQTGFNWFGGSYNHRKPLSQPQFKIYFATPACFDHGWLPGQDPNDWNDFFTQPVRLCAAAVHRYESYGGFDMAAKADSDQAHKPAHRYIPAGSVYYFAWQSNPGGLRPDLVQNAITHSGAEIGFGQVFMEVW